MLRTTHALSALITAVLMATCSLLDFSAFEASFRRVSGTSQGKQFSGVRQHAKQSVPDKVSREGVSAGLDLLEEEASMARVGLREYHQDLDRCILMVWMPEMMLVHSWQYECLRPMLDAPADAYGNRLLHIAARSGNREAVELLLELGARADEQNLMGQTARDVLKCHDGVSRFSMIASLDGISVPAPGIVEPTRAVLATRPVDSLRSGKPKPMGRPVLMEGTRWQERSKLTDTPKWVDSSTM